MSFYGSSEEHQPMMWVRGHAVYAAHVVVGAFVASMLVTAVLLAANSGAMLNWLTFSTVPVLHGEAWRIFTYGLVNRPGIWFAIDMLMLVWFGREVEKFFGRRKFLALFAGIYLLPPLMLTAAGRWIPSSLVGESGAFAIFVAFATLYPNVPIFFSVLSKWAAGVLVAIYTLGALADHDWATLVSLWATTGFAFLFVRYQQGHLSLPQVRPSRRRTIIRVNPEPVAAKPVRASLPEASMAEVDALLDKIAQSGIGSLTAKERAKLDAAREDLKRRSRL